MKKVVCLLIISLLAFALLTGCGGGGSNESSSDTNTSSDSNASDLDMGQNEVWPADSVPAELPEYKDGDVANSAQDGNNVIIVVKNTNEEALAEYVEALKSAGWIVREDSGEAALGRFTVRYQWNNSESTALQIDVYTEDAGGWPSDEIPPDILPPETGTLVTVTSLSGSDEEGWTFDYTYDNMSEESVQSYMQMLIGKGWEGDISMVVKSFDWNGKSYEAMVQVYESSDNRATFTCGFQGVS